MKEESETKFENPRTFKFPPTPTPPATINAPVIEFVEPVELVTNILPLKEESEPKFENPRTFKFPPMPTPPKTTNAPVFEFAEETVLETNTEPDVSRFPPI